MSKAPGSGQRVKHVLHSTGVSPWANTMARFPRTLSPAHPPLLQPRVPPDCLPTRAQGGPSTEEGLLSPAGKFWHISDLHLDPNYKASEDPFQVCPSAGSQAVPNPGPWGDYLCDAPWLLINSSIHAMKEIEPEPDFILWTG